MDYGMPGSSASTISPNLFRLMSFVWVMLSNHLILSCPVILCLPSFPASGSLPVSQLFTSGGQNIGSLPAVFPVNIHIFPQLSSFSRVWLFATPWTAACQTSLFITNSRSLLRFMSIESVMPSNHLILCHPLLLLPSVFPSIRWLKYWSFSFSISPSNEYSGLISFRIDWLVWSPCSPRDSRESSPTPQFKSVNSLELSFLYSPTLTSIHDHWKNSHIHSFD